MAVTYNNIRGNSGSPVTPCGICRQSLMEQEEKSQHPMRLVLAGLTGSIYIISSAYLLLPLAFNSRSIEKLAL